MSWWQDARPDGPHHPLSRAGRRGARRPVRRRSRRPFFPDSPREHLTLGEVFEILCAFYHGPVRPTKFRWRSLHRELQFFSALDNAPASNHP